MLEAQRIDLSLKGLRGSERDNVAVTPRPCVRNGLLDDRHDINRLALQLQLADFQSRDIKKLIYEPMQVVRLTRDRA